MITSRTPAESESGNCPHRATIRGCDSRFKPEFFRWLDSLHPGDWQRNRDYKKARAEFDAKKAAPR